jgi:hypothetical protein
VDRGAGVMLGPDCDSAVLRDTVRGLIERPLARDAARAIVPENCARVAAAELLCLVRPPATVDAVAEMLSDERLGRLCSARASELDVLSLAHRFSRGREEELWGAAERCMTLLERFGTEARELRGLVDAVVRGVPSSSVAARAEICAAVLGELGGLAAGDGRAAVDAVAGGRWGREGSVDGVSLAAAMRAVRT